MSTREKRIKNWSFWGFLVLSAMLIVSLTKGIRELLGTRVRFEKAEQEVALLQEQAESLEAQVNNGEDFWAEKEIRDKLGLSRPNEMVVILPEEWFQEFEQDYRGSGEVQKEVPNWQKWWRVFF